MKIKKISKHYEKFPVWLKIVFGVATILTVIYLLFFTYIKYQDYLDIQKERRIKVKFDAESLTVPEMKSKITKNPWGSVYYHVVAEIENKGSVNFVYDENGVGTIYSIGSFDTTFDCIYLNSDGKIDNRLKFETRYYLVGFNLRKDSPYKKIFPVEVSTLRNLVDEYDEIIKILKTLPAGKHITEGNDVELQKIVDNYDPKYTIYQKISGRNAVCGIFQFKI